MTVNDSLDMPVCYADSQEKLGEVLKCLATEPLIGVDTEFVRIETLYPLVALVQLYDGKRVYLVDVISLDMKQRDAFWKAFVASDARFVFFSMREDLEVIYHCSGSLPKHIDDLQMMLPYVGETRKLGLAAIIKLLLGVEILKDQTTSIWMTRPLNSQQIRYAALDVYYLLDMYRILKERIDANGHSRYYDQDVMVMVIRTLHPADPDKAYLKHADSSMSVRQMARLRELVRYRRRKGEEENIALSRIIPGAALPKLVKTRMHDGRSLVIAGMHPKAVKLYGHDILDILYSSHLDEDGIFTGSLIPNSEYSKFGNMLIEDIRAFCDSRGIHRDAGVSRRETSDLCLWLGCDMREQLETPPVLYSPWKTEFLEKILRDSQEFGDSDLSFLHVDVGRYARTESAPQGAGDAPDKTASAAGDGSINSGDAG
ncbi:MAG: HRDC domain-containing protein [Succinivibrionaceae bacterium]|nr:HRDC domain-containing protein [Succinivibrionaceae bacterium]